ncbi:metalloregulator ArsR/SmtB family transcription factor [Streptomyces olivaceus]|uniref:ArsR/SmtB family transcription factor n=1 Tax=Streptomyces TaxID=1883 RepID=UPI001CCF34F4|nr:metalloregulator ArsR/SmtB family transcription factor [Streptomyces olivaceus]MBZ6256754.1 metalloregulator ArsR/SmtB family transcription factor [Streptomyces olivaceus]WTC47088.1 metalloregulator ArsR/SmtB family transcription factor [Streptomyces anthocyanicus]
MLSLATDLDALTRFGRALADPIRCRILLALREEPAHPATLADLLEISRTRLSNHLACLRDCGLVVAVPEGRRVRYELADERLGHALDDLRTAVVAVEADKTCVDAETKGCC